MHELYDSAARQWLPADPSSGLVGLEDWMQGRVGFSERVSLNPITRDMIVSIAIFAADANGDFTINRTRHYLVDAFDARYGRQAAGQTPCGRNGRRRSMRLPKREALSRFPGVSEVQAGYGSCHR